MSPQLDLFAPLDSRPSGEPGDGLAAVHAEAAELAGRIDPLIRFGTSSWSFPGWRGIVYSRAMSDSALARDGLREYARHPLLRTVGIDRSFYAPIPDEDLQRYASQLPGGFLACAKAGASVTSAVLPGARGEEPVANPTFLSPGVFIDEMLTPFARHFRAFTGPFVLDSWERHSMCIKQRRPSGARTSRRPLLLTAAILLLSGMLERVASVGHSDRPVARSAEAARTRSRIRRARLSR